MQDVTYSQENPKSCCGFLSKPFVVSWLDLNFDSCWLLDVQVCHPSPLLVLYSVGMAGWGGASVRAQRAYVHVHACLAFLCVCGQTSRRTVGVLECESSRIHFNMSSYFQRICALGKWVMLNKRSLTLEEAVSNMRSQVNKYDQSNVFVLGREICL